ncbi:SDR family oxidoreductase [Hyphomonas jannaschiana]|uniref:Short chain dehydrogenase/reductase family oxidoreductase n=1 Tax=Hyphomonas jannaschiana VP2 TaxID=1280952 RepID=A0A059F813_9PROT|nr:SDR family oxidoreductase [Hyphomonas jannaschiana]KCZ86688.1 short chain dehydrogenase/reductase family oxidoreductase [Hyphomonas jannaschiana VP2]
MKTVIITGASTGIGAGAARHLAAKGWRVFAGVRKHADGEMLKLKSSGVLCPIILDVTKPDQVAAAVETVSEALGGERLAGLVNNAGIAKMGPLAIQPMEDFRAHFEVNVFGLLAMTQACVPLLGADPARNGLPGRIVNITSVGGRLSSPFLGAYAATKHAVEAMTDSLRRELVIYGIDAIAIGPGSVKTPIWDKAEADNTEGPYASSDWGESLKQFEQVMLSGGRSGLAPEEIAGYIETALAADKPKARYAPVPDKLTNWTIPTRLPKRLLDKIFWKRFGLK